MHSETKFPNKHFFTDTFGEPCESTLESDPVCRFHYVAKVVGLEKSDEEILHKYSVLTTAMIPSIVDRVYARMFEFLPMKKHFAVQHDGYYGHVPNTVDEVTLDHSQTKFRKQRLKEYLEKLGTASHDETFAVLLDVISRIHTTQQGNPMLDVPLVQVTAILGYLSEQFLSEIARISELGPNEFTKLQSAYHKLFWIQNSMFLRHYALR